MNRKRKREQSSSLLTHIEHFNKKAALQSIDADDQLDEYAKAVIRAVTTRYFQDVRPCIDSLPNELLQHIMSYLSDYSLIIAKAVCKRFYLACKACALLKRRIKIAPVPWVLRHYPNCQRLCIDVKHRQLLSADFFVAVRDELRSSSVELALRVPDHCKPAVYCLSTLELKNVISLELRNSSIDCPCYLLRGVQSTKKESSIACHFPNIRQLLLHHIAGSSHAYRCKLLTYIKRNLSSLEHLQIGDRKYGIYEHVLDTSCIAPRIFRKPTAPNLRSLKLCFLQDLSAVHWVSQIPMHMPELRWLELVLPSEALFEVSQYDIQPTILLRTLSTCSQLQTVITHIPRACLQKFSYETGSVCCLSRCIDSLPDAFCRAWRPIFHMCSSQDFYYDYLLPCFKSRGVLSAVV